MFFVRFEEIPQGGPAKCPVYLKLPWIEEISKTFGQSIKLITDRTFLSLDLLVCFWQKLSSYPLTKNLNRLQCECRSRYVGRTNQKLGDRIKQHVTSVIRNKTQPSREQPDRQCRSSHFIGCDSAVGKHLLFNKSCAETYSDGNFRILYKCLSAIQLKVMEALSIKLNDPDLIRHKEFVFLPVLYWLSCISPGWCHQFLWLYTPVICFFWVSRRIALDQWSAEMDRALS